MTDPTPGPASGQGRRGRPDHHDPTAGIGGAPPAHSALTLRLVLATFGLLVCIVGIIWTLSTDGPVWLAVALGVLAVITVIDLVVIARRKQRGEPG